MATKVARLFAEITFEILVALAIALTLAVLATPARAGCRDFYRKQVVVQQVAVAYAQPIYVAPPVYYSAGDELKIRAIAAAEARTAIKQELSLIQQQAHQNYRQSVGQSVAPVAPVAPTVFAKCAQCHTGENAAGGLVLDGVTPIDCRALFRWGQIAGQGKHVPPKMAALIGGMSPEQKGAIQDAMLDLVEQSLAIQDASPPPAPVLEPEPPPADRPPPPPRSSPFPEDGLK